MAFYWEYIQGSDLPDATAEWRDSTGALINFSAGHTFVLKIGTPGQTALITKSTGITGAATAPNITIAWATSGELNTLTVGVWAGHLIATRTSDSKERKMPVDIRILPQIT